jgi:hypothetical protein
MPLLPFARPAIADRNMRAVRFTMKDGSRPVDILVSNPALESIDIVPDQPPLSGPVGMLVHGASVG